MHLVKKFCTLHVPFSVNGFEKGHPYFTLNLTIYLHGNVIYGHDMHGTQILRFQG